MTAEARPHVIVLPGGGYSARSAHEGEPVAEWLRGLGLDASVLDYPVRTRHPGPIDAFRMRAAELRADGVTRLGVLGFSAGGHLAGHALHVYPHGRHGLGLVQQCAQVSADDVADAGSAVEWTRSCEAWLRELGWIRGADKR